MAKCRDCGKISDDVKERCVWTFLCDSCNLMVDLLNRPYEIDNDNYGDGE